jgi:hypothetical protein
MVRVQIVRKIYSLSQVGSRHGWASDKHHGNDPRPDVGSHVTGVIIWWTGAHLRRNVLKRDLDSCGLPELAFGWPPQLAEASRDQSVDRPIECIEVLLALKDAPVPVDHDTAIVCR